MSYNHSKYDRYETKAIKDDKAMTTDAFMKWDGMNKFREIEK